MLIALTPIVAVAGAVEYYPAVCTTSYPNIDCVYGCANLPAIAAANGITCYTGTAAQKHMLVALMITGNLQKVGSGYVAPVAQKGFFAPYKGGPTTSLVDAMKCMGLSSSFATRKLIAVANGICDYTGSTMQNTYLLGLLIAGKLKCPPCPTCPTTCTPACPTTTCPAPATCAPCAVLG